MDTLLLFYKVSLFSYASVLYWLTICPKWHRNRIRSLRLIYFHRHRFHWPHLSKRDCFPGQMIHIIFRRHPKSIDLLLNRYIWSVNRIDNCREFVATIIRTESLRSYRTIHWTEYYCWSSIDNYKCITTSTDTAFKTNIRSTATTCIFPAAATVIIFNTSSTTCQINYETNDYNSIIENCTGNNCYNNKIR